jgi:hypothetical protein
MLGHEGALGVFLDHASLLDRANEGAPIKAEILTHAWVVTDSKTVRNKKLVNGTQRKRLVVG